VNGNADPTRPGVSLMAVFLLPLLLLFFVPQKEPTESVISFIKPGTIHIGDHSLADWNGIRAISLTCADQWQTLSCKDKSRPDACRSDRDLQSTFYLAWDASNLLFAVNVVDDVVLPVPRTSKGPWGGDAAELFFVAECEAQDDYHDCVQQDKPAFQLLLCPNDLQDKRYHLATYRTPDSVIQKALQDGFQVNGWKTKDGWQAEAVFPLAALGKAKATILSGKPVKIAFDILDYDGRLAEQGLPCYGFEPDHVVSNMKEQQMASNPGMMKEFSFEAVK
jgi:hypothetical protein